MRRNLALGSAVLLVAFAFWLGEGGSPPWAVTPLASAFIAALLVAVFMPGKRWVKSVGGSVL